MDETTVYVAWGVGGDGIEILGVFRDEAKADKLADTFSMVRPDVMDTGVSKAITVQ